MAAVKEAERGDTVGCVDKAPWQTCQGGSAGGRAGGGGAGAGADLACCRA